MTKVYLTLAACLLAIICNAITLLQFQVSCGLSALSGLFISCDMTSRTADGNKVELSWSSEADLTSNLTVTEYGATYASAVADSPSSCPVMSQTDSERLYRTRTPFKRDTLIEHIHIHCHITVNDYPSSVSFSNQSLLSLQ
ncbi:hypothetical protein J6590_057609 [Homalodisca vitripennis]|nr:hypothetical protein J6590_057609 [Homalodisca vitripennis]